MKKAKTALKRIATRILEASNRLQLPAPSVLPVAGAVVGLYSGLAAGVFANMVTLVGSIALAPAIILDLMQPGSTLSRRLLVALEEAPWHLEYAIVGVSLALPALWLAKHIEPSVERDLVRTRLRVLAMLLLIALSLYYPLVALSAANRALAHHPSPAVLAQLPWWLVLAAPSLGGVLVGYLLRRHPETHGHGVPEVIAAIQDGGVRLDSRRGFLKLAASAITIGTGGSAGREGPVVFGGAAFGATVGKTLGFSEKELSILLASGAGAGIAASFNAPIAGAIFAMEIILREFELKVVSPIFLASVTATMLARGVMGGAPMLARLNYRMVSGWEILAYAALGLLCGLLAFAFIRLLHATEATFQGRKNLRLSRWLGAQPLMLRAGLGGLLTGTLVLVNPVVWGTGHDFANLATVGRLSFGFLVSACLLKLVATALTVGSGGSGGTFFPSLVIGAMAGGALGRVVHAAFPQSTALGGAYAIVGMGGAVAALNRGPMTGMIMLYELSRNYAIILPLMVTCTVASALCHALLERGPSSGPTRPFAASES